MSENTANKPGHFLLSTKVRDISTYEIARLNDRETIELVVKLRWGSLQDCVCPSCGAISKPFFRVRRGQLRCRHCQRDFSPFHATVFEDRKLPINKILTAIVHFVEAEKGIAATHLARIINVQVKTAFVLLHKLRETLLRNADQDPLEGLVEADGGHFCGKPRSGRVRRRPKNEDIAAAVEARLKGQVPKPMKNRTTRANMVRRKNRRIVMVYRQHSGFKGHGASKTRVAIAMQENSEAADLLASRFISTGARVWTDESGAYINYSQSYEHEVVEHSIEYSSIDGINENQAESYFSRLRRAELGVFHGFRPKYLSDYAQEFAWREDVRRCTCLEKLGHLFAAIHANGLSRWWRGYWQGHHRACEFMVVGKH